MKKFIFYIALIAIETLNFAYADGLVALKSNVLINGDTVTADCLLKEEASKDVRDELSSIRLGYISEPFGKIILNKELVEKKLSNIDKNIDIPENIVVKRTGSILHSDDVIECIKSACAESIDGEFRLDVTKVPRTIVLPGNLISYSVETTAENNLGMKLFTVKGETDSGAFRQIVQVNVSKIIDVAKMKRLAKAGEIITDEMVTKESIEIKSDKTNVPLTYDEVIGKQLGKFKSAGTIIRDSDLNTGKSKIKNRYNSKKIVAINNVKPETYKSEAENTINDGDTVEFSVKSGNLSVSIPARAMQSGAVGDEITLLNLQNKKKIRGIVVKKGFVEYAQK